MQRGESGRNLMQTLAVLFRSLTAVVAVVALLGGCVTTTTGGSKAKIDKQKALETHVQLGLSYLRQKDIDLARHHFNKAYAIDSNNKGAHNGRALLYQLQGELELAEATFRKALQVDPDFTQARNNYGSFLYRQKRYPEAYEQFEKVAGDLDYPRRAIALLSLGRTAKKLGRTERAKAAFNQALILQPRLASAMVELAEIHFVKEEYAESKKYLDQYDSIARQSARTLWLGIRIERIFGNRDREASYALALKNLHPYSKEYLQYQRSLKQEQ